MRPSPSHRPAWPPHHPRDASPSAPAPLGRVIHRFALPQRAALAAKCAEAAHLCPGESRAGTKLVPPGVEPVRAMLHGQPLSRGNRGGGGSILLERSVVVSFTTVSVFAWAHTYAS